MLETLEKHFKYLKILNSEMISRKPQNLLRYKQFEILYNMQSRYFFDDVDQLVAYIYSQDNDIFKYPIKLQKGLYFLYAYYSLMYNQPIDDEEVEAGYNLPPELFPARFEAWTYGPVIREVYAKYQQDNYNQDLAKTINTEEHFSGFGGEEVKRFINGLLSQVLRSSDFSLVDRCHQDNAWRSAFQRGRNSIMDNEAIIKEYRERFGNLI